MLTRISHPRIGSIELYNKEAVAPILPGLKLQQQHGANAFLGTIGLQEYASADGPMQLYSYSLKPEVDIDLEQEADAFKLLIVLDGSFRLRTNAIEWYLQAGDLCMFECRQFQLRLPELSRLNFLLYNIEPLVKRMELGAFNEGRCTPGRKTKASIEEILHAPAQLAFPEKWLSVNLSQLLLALLEQMQQPGEKQDERDHLRAFALTADRYIREHLTMDLSTLQIARAVGMNECTLKQIFSEHFGTGMAKRQNQLRIDLAKELLLQTNKSIRDIGFECGYIREATFRENFDKLTQLTPAEYRKIHKR